MQYAHKHSVYCIFIHKNTVYIMFMCKLNVKKYEKKMKKKEKNDIEKKTQNVSKAKRKICLVSDYISKKFRVGR